MKTYIVYNDAGEEIGYIKARSHNSAEKKAIARYGKFVHVSYTEI